MEESIENQESKLINWKTIAVGSIITVVGFTISVLGVYFRWHFPLTVLLFAILNLGPIIGGFTTAYLNAPKYKIGIINGTIATFIGFLVITLIPMGILLVFILIGEIIYGYKYDNKTYYFYELLYNNLLIILYGIFGAFIGTSIKKLKIKYKS